MLGQKVFWYVRCQAFIKITTCCWYDLWRGGKRHFLFVFVITEFRKEYDGYCNVFGLMLVRGTFNHVFPTLWRRVFLSMNDYSVNVASEHYWTEPSWWIVDNFALLRKSFPRWTTTEDVTSIIVIVKTVNLLFAYFVLLMLGIITKAFGDNLLFLYLRNNKHYITLN